MSGEMFGPYRVLSRIGKGGMGEVHEAYDTVRDRTIALKRLVADADDGAAAERFRRESRIAARLASPHVVPIHDFGVIDERLFIDMRLVRGTDLGALLQAQGPLALPRTARIVAHVADALDSAHAEGLVHRDVKPSNVLLVRQREGDFAYLADFGIVHMRGGTRPERLTATDTVLGTPAYIAPEQLRGDSIDHRVDVYALGCVLFRMTTGRPPFVGDTLSVVYDHVHSPPPDPGALRPDLPTRLVAELLRALDKDPGRRHGSAGELADAVRASLDQPAADGHLRLPRPPASLVPDTAMQSEPRAGGNDTGPVPRASLPRPSVRRRKPPAVVVGVVVLGALLAVVLYLVLGRAAPSVAPEMLEAQIVAQTGLSPGQVSCSTSLPAEVGASVDCTARVGDREQRLRTTVTTVTDDRVVFDISTG